ncbi:uncharacterized protein LOC129796232 [Lutzomyia longipalpis]|uniref:uncharacterized protein LOC129796232 n=1 Tax=Lutzomyia longipalpis TaxID=7200 RepID=UPI002484734F|nr:uncharacterized protein LOC129796232 [Lutzomyia longipalpis]
MKRFSDIIQSFFHSEQADDEVSSCEESQSMASNITPETPHGDSQDAHEEVSPATPDLVNQPAIMSYSQIVRYPPPPIPHLVPIIPTAPAMSQNAPAMCQNAPAMCQNAPAGESLVTSGSNFTISRNFVVVERTTEATGQKYLAVVPVSTPGTEGNAHGAQMEQPGPPVQGTGLVRYGETRNPIYTDLRNQVKQFALNLRKERKALRTRECNGMRLLQKILEEEDLSTEDRLALIRLYFDSTGYP